MRKHEISCENMELHAKIMKSNRNQHVDLMLIWYTQTYINYIRGLILLYLYPLQGYTDYYTYTPFIALRPLGI